MGDHNDRDFAAQLGQARRQSLLTGTVKIGIRLIE